MINWTIPQTITQGDRVTWTQLLDGYNPITDTLSCFIRGAMGGLDLTGVPNTEGWDFTILEAQSATLATGNYKAQFVVFATGQGRQTLGLTDLLVCPSFESVTTFDGRSDDEKELEVITTAIARLAGGAVSEYRVGDRMMRYQDLEQLTKRQRELRIRIKYANNPYKTQNVGIRFGIE